MFGAVMIGWLNLYTDGEICLQFPKKQHKFKEYYRNSFIKLVPRDEHATHIYSETYKELGSSMED